jgi:hypothetical protein
VETIQETGERFGIVSDRGNAMTSHPFARRAVVAVAVLVVMLLAAPSAALGLTRGPLAGPKTSG